MTLTAFVLAAAVTLAPLKPAQTIDLSKHGVGAADVTWLSDRDLLVALAKGGVVRVSLDGPRVTEWLPQGEIPHGVPSPELIATDGDLVVVMGGGRRNYVFRKRDGTHVDGHTGGPLNPRGLAVARNTAFYIGWVTRMGTSEDQQRGVLWSQPAGKPLIDRPIHRIVSDGDALARWRLTMHPYAGSMVALDDGSIAVITSAEPGIYRYDADGKLAGILGSGIESLVVDSPALVKSYGRDVVGRYDAILDRQPSIEDLVAAPEGLAILVRVADGPRIQWQLWYPGASEVKGIQPLEPKLHGPIAHMKCEARRDRMACVTNRPDAEQARQPGPAASNPTLFVYRLAR